MIKNILYFLASLIVFVAGVVVYGILLNISEPSLYDAMISKGLTHLTRVHIVIDRKNYLLYLYSDTTMVKEYKAVFGRNNSSLKQLKMDYATPIGKYFICNIDTNSRYKKFLRISYPNYDDASHAMDDKLITNQEYFSIVEDLDNYSCASIIKNDLHIGIHGIGKMNFIFKNLPFIYNWTNGSVAVSDENIDEIYSVINVGTEVVIKN